MIIQHNINAMNANRQLGVTTSSQAKSTEKLSSGYKINRAADDAAGLTISEKMRSQIRGLTQASANAQDGISAVQTAEGALNEVEDMLQRMNELAVKAKNDTNTSEDRTAIQSEINALTSEINRVKDSTEFNSQKLLDGTFTNKQLQVGAHSDNTIALSIDNMSASSIGVGNLNVTSASGAGSAIDSIKDAIASVSAQRSSLGAVQNRLEHTIKNLDNVVENTTAAESQIRDCDMASQMVEFTKNNILAQAGQAMLAQANQSTSGVLSLLG